MKKIINALAITASLALFAAIAVPNPGMASDFTASQTVSNLAVGVNDQTDATVATQTNLVAGTNDQTDVTTTPTPASAGVAQVNLITVSGTVETNDVYTITVPAGTVSYTVSPSDTTTTNIASGIGAALVATSTYAAAPYTVATSTNTVTLTAKATNTAFTQTSATTNRSARVQINTVSVGGTVETNDVYTITVPAGTVSYTVSPSDTTTTNIASGIGAALVATSTYAAAPYTVATSTNTVVFTAKIAGTPYVQSSATTNRAARAQVVTFTPDTVGDLNYTVTLNGTDYTIRGSGSASAVTIVTAMNTALAGNPAASCSQDGVKVTCVALTPGTAFTYAASASVPVSSSGGGGSHRSGGSAASSAANNGTVNANPSPAALAHASPNAAFNRDLKLGASGADVMALQAYLNAHGFMIASVGAGSKGSETTHFGGLTKAALAKLQAANGILPSVGYFGPKTRAYINAHP